MSFTKEAAELKKYRDTLKATLPGKLQAAQGAVNWLEKQRLIEAVLIAGEVRDQIMRKVDPYQRVNFFKKYVDESRELAAEGNKIDPFDIRTSHMENLTARKIYNINESDLDEIIQVIEEKPLYEVENPVSVELFERMKEFGFSVKIVKDEIQPLPFAPTSGMAKLGVDIAAALEKCLKPRNLEGIEGLYKPGKMINGQWPAETEKKYHLAAWKSFEAARTNSGEPKTFAVEKRDIPKTCHKQFEALDSDEARLYVFGVSLNEIGTKWLQQTPSRIKKSIEGGWMWEARKE